jgi:hypothetical protein
MSNEDHKEDITKKNTPQDEDFKRVRAKVGEKIFLPLSLPLPPPLSLSLSLSLSLFLSGFPFYVTSTSAASHPRHRVSS